VCLLLDVRDDRLYDATDEVGRPREIEVPRLSRPRLSGSRITQLDDANANEPEPAAKLRIEERELEAG